MTKRKKSLKFDSHNCETMPSCMNDYKNPSEAALLANLNCGNCYWKRECKKGSKK